MKLSWTSLKISIAGARLSHLVQKDKVWDYGSMTEQVKNIFMQMKKAQERNQPEHLKKYATIQGYEILKTKIDNDKKSEREYCLNEVSILNVKLRNKHLPDRFCALLKGVKNKIADESLQANVIQKKFSQRWKFIRQGDWWLLDEV